MTYRTTHGDVEVTSYRGRESSDFLADLARLRIEVFREFPYLYDGTLDYEERYLLGYTKSEDSVVVVARRGGEVVGVSTALPVLAHSDEVAPVLERAGFSPERFYYFGESVLRADVRGLGVGHAFFDHRERAARLAGTYTHTGFCAVVRPAEHPARPVGYVSHHAFWSKRGYVERPDVVASFSWKDLGASEETDKPMVFWVRALDSE